MPSGRDQASYSAGSNPPKSLPQIRKALKPIVNGNDGIEPGPLRAGLGKNDMPIHQMRRRPSRQRNPEEKARDSAMRAGAGIGMMIGAACGILASVVTKTSSPYPAIGFGIGGICGSILGALFYKMRTECK
jgi:hypothetical protein